MDPERWRQVKELYQAVVDRPAEQHDTFLAQACGGDEELRREVESLLAQRRQGGVLDTPPSGGQLGPYRILEKIGAGGMGVVFKARDTRLDRIVALKISTPEFSRRSAREARAISALNHPHICGLYDVGEQDRIGYLVMEYVEGPTLAERLGHGPLPFAEVLRCGAQIADALAAAHGRGIVHRDLKPANIVLAESGVKVLDFGLAKLENAEESQETLTASHAIVGTLAYMAPEQLEGKPCDARSDIFALGLLLYEMAAGRKAFPADSQAGLIAAVMGGEPAPIAGAPPSFAHVVRRCLARDPAERWQSAADVRLELNDLAGERGRSAAFGKRRFGKRALAAAAAGLLALSAAGIIWWRSLMPGAQPLRIVPLTTYPGVSGNPAFSPDGSRLAFTWNGGQGDNMDVYVKMIGSADQPLRFTDNPQNDFAPAWSPDGRQIAFVRSWPKRRCALFLMPSMPGAERKVAEFFPLSPPRIAWTPDGRWIVVPHSPSDSGPSRLYLASVETGELRPLTDPPVLFRGDLDGVVSPDGRNLAFVRAPSGSVSDIYVVALSRDYSPSGEPRRLTNENWAVFRPMWTADGRELIYASSKAGLVSLWRMRAWGSGPPRLLTALAGGGGGFTISAQGDKIAFSVRSPARTGIWRARLSRDGVGAPAPFAASTMTSADPSLSPDGRRITFASSRSGSSQIWICNSDGSSMRQLTFLDSPLTGFAHWSPDGSEIAFDARVGGNTDVWVIGVDGGTPRRLTMDPAEDMGPTWSRDGKWIYFSSNRSGAFQVWKQPSHGSGPAVQVTRNGGWPGIESTDGKYFYYGRALNSTGVWRTPVEGGEEAQVIPLVNAVHNFNVLPDGIFYQTGGKPISFWFYRFATGVPEPRGSIDRPLGHGMTVSPDLQWLLFTSTEPSGEESMRLIENVR